MNFLASTWQLRAGVIRWALVCVPVVLMLGILSGVLSGSGADEAWFAALRKPVGYPPPATFGLVWSVLYILMGLSLAIVLSAAGARGRGLAAAVFALQLAINLTWSPLFFGAHRITGALVDILLLDVAVVATIVLFARIRPSAAWLLAPYLAWILFATYLNFAILQDNREFDGVHPSGAVERIEF
ncbi:tryptophan-rich sensory protein [Novosphingobium chloroacetimidivorans]|uniref:Tryptophan-rich sensory protein n=1 Tax=Novosphingobium chloroacetimidivorans TaxID=1428314 RepID=A0A7W7KAY2_9SPHN|nr:TspO/MBR family protein [Novosphingobium chloroacetimidivorans]MBB4859484.1 tryptophan-rich sensory protein [Novosphingobium chloroacetimidivorans]